ncbi:MAG TPA: PAS domain S-box protein, partial [Gemmatimonas sp.]|nr:PAS domain S-box protein [Gemmatimonas sp.]
ARRRDGTTFPIDTSISQVESDEGRLFTVILRDVSARVAAEAERAQVENALRESETRARILFRDSPMPMWVFDLETTRILDVNDAALARYGYTREEFCALSAAALRPPEDVPRFLASVAEPRRGLAHIGIFRHVTKAGTPFDVEVTAQDTTYDNRPARVVLSKDITERQVAEDALRRSEQRYALAVRATGNAIWEWDLMTDILTWSEGAPSVMGYVSPVPSALSWWADRVHPDDRTRVMDSLGAVTDASSDTDDWRARYRFRREDGTYAVVVDCGSVLRDTTRQGVRMIGAMEDITAQVMLEAQLRQAQKMEAVGQLAGGVAHDFNNLLTIIQGNLAFVQAEMAADHPARSDLDEVRMAADRAGTLVRQLLTFSRQQPVQPEDVQLTEVVGQAEKLLRRVIGEEISLVVTLSEDSTLVHADPGQLEQVLMNLAVNARDAMLTPQHGHDGRGGTLSIDVDAVTLAPSESRTWDQVRPGRWVRLVVRDTGHGMDADTQTHIFEPFFTTKAIGAGTGLGLSTVFGIVRQAGGAIRVDSSQGRGTTFTILLPALAQDASNGAVRRGMATPVSTAAVHTTVLLVEDEKGVRATVRRILERHGYAVLEARNGADALLLWRAHRDAIGVLVTDLRMPELGGRELVAHLSAERPELPAVLISGYADAPDIPSTRPQQVTLAKPFTINALLTAVSDAMQATPV